MRSGNWEFINDVFEAALEVPKDQRDHFVKEACDGNAELESEILKLLVADERVGSFLETDIVPPSFHPQPTCRFSPGSIVADRYRVVTLLGQGGMGEVYAADDLRLGQRVALKFLRLDCTNSKLWRDQFYSEVRTARQISHPNICRVHDVGESDGKLFLSMEFVDGEDLRTLLRRIGRLPGEKALELAQELCLGIAAAHRSGVLHRDLKPSNVMIDGKGRVRITDFGIAVVTSKAERVDVVAGTPGYLAPELLEGAVPSARSDVYALGLVLYELFTGRGAFEGSSYANSYRRRSEKDVLPPSKHVVDLDPTIERVILQCLSHDPLQRPYSALSIAASLGGKDPLSVALAAGETPDPAVVAAAGPHGSLKPAAAWSCFTAAVILMLITSGWIARHSTWGLSSLNKSPDVLADHAQELAQRLGFRAVQDRTFWLDEDSYVIWYLYQNNSFGRSVLTSKHEMPPLVAFWYRQSPTWMEPNGTAFLPLNVTYFDPPYEVSGMVTLKLDAKGRLLSLRAVPPQVDNGGAAHEFDWGQLFVEAGLEKARFTAAKPTWTPPEAFDSRLDWEGQSPDQPDLRLHVSAAAYRGTPVYFQVIAPWNSPWRSQATEDIVVTPFKKFAAAIPLLLMVGYLVGGTFLAQRHYRQGRGDTKGVARVACFISMVTGFYMLSNSHPVLDADYMYVECLSLIAHSFFPALAVSIGYMAIEPYARRAWPNLLVSWQRLVRGGIKDALVGRNMLIGGLAGSALAASRMLLDLQFKPPLHVSADFGRGLWPTIGRGMVQFAPASYWAFFYLALLTLTTILVRRRWIAVTTTGLVLFLLSAPWSASEVCSEIITIAFLLTILLCFELVGLMASLFVWGALSGIPPLDLTRWYGGLAGLGLFLALAPLVFGFYTSQWRHSTVLDTLRLKESDNL